MVDTDRETRSVEIWERIRQRLRADVDEVVYGPWLEPLTFVESRGGVVRLALPSRFRREWVADTYGAHILAMWREHDAGIAEVEIVVRPRSRPTPKDGGQKHTREPKAVKDARVADRARDNRRGAGAIESVRETNRGANQVARIRHQLPAADADALALRALRQRRNVDALATKVGDGCGLDLQPLREQLGKVGVWSRSPYFYEANKATSLAVAAEELGYRALWIPGFDGGHIFERCELALKASTRLTIATGVVNIWRHDPAEVARTVNKLRADSGGRFLLGIGGSHKFLIGDAYDKISPLAKMRNYLDELDAAGLPPENRLLGALGPKMLALSAERAAGTHPCFIPPEFTGAARDVIGDGPLLVPEVTVILESDPNVARALARKFAGLYFKGPNYANMLRRFGFTDNDFNGEGSDRLIDAVVAWGDPETIATRVRTHLDAGADHVAIQSRGPKPEADVWRELAPRVLG